MISDHAEETLGTSVTLSEVTAPVKLPTWHCPTPGSRVVVRIPTSEEWYPTGDSMTADAITSQSPTYPVHLMSKLNTKLQ